MKRTGPQRRRKWHIYVLEFSLRDRIFQMEAKGCGGSWEEGSLPATEAAASAAGISLFALLCSAASFPKFSFHACDMRNIPIDFASITLSAQTVRLLDKTVEQKIIFNVPHKRCFVHLRAILSLWRCLSARRYLVKKSCGSRALAIVYSEAQSRNIFRAAF